jgi:hypothetical protein
MFRSRFTAAGLAALMATTLACSHKAESPTAPSGQGGGDAAAAADGSTLKTTAPTPIAPVSDQQVNDSPTLSASVATLKYSTPVAFTYRFQVFNAAGTQVQDSGLQPSPSFKVTASLAFKTRHTWRVRAEYQGAVGPWSATASFISPEGGYIRGNEVFDPLYNGKTVGELIGPTTWVPDKGIRLDTVQSYVRYTIPQTITSGEFSMEVQGLQANAPGDKSKVFGMSSNGPDFVTDPYRVDIQYRGTGGAPPNAITFRALYGSGDDLDVRYEPDTGTRYASVVMLDPGTTYFWKFTWGSEARLTVRQGGAKDNGPIIYNWGKASPDGTYNPMPMYAYLGTPVGRSGAESATIPGTIYRNVWIGARPRP